MPQRVKRRFAARTALLAAVAWLACGPSALAQSPVDVATRWGLLGGWMLDCGKPVGPSNALLSFVVRDGKVNHDRNFGDSRDSNPVVAAKLARNGMIDVSIYFSGLSQTRQIEWIKDPAGRLRAISNRNVDTNEFTVKDGILTANGQETRWQTRCAKGQN